MNLDIGGNLRRLRNTRNITQEELANYIGVSFQAVSKWERGDGYPDITFILPLASFFCVSIDELLCMNFEKEEKQVDEIIKNAENLIEGIHFITDENRHLFGEQVAILAEGYKRFPNNFKLMIAYASSLQPDFRIMEKDIFELERRSFELNGSEVEHISRRVLQECTDTKLRYLATIMLVRAYAFRGELDKATELCKTFPDYPISQNIMMTNIYNNGNEDAILQYRKVFHELFKTLICKINGPYQKTEAEKVKCWEKTIALCDAFFDEGEYGSLSSQVIAARLNCSVDFDTNPERADMYIKKAFETAKREDEIRCQAGTYKYESFLVRGVELDIKNDFAFDKKNTAVQFVNTTLEMRKA